ncbi:MAG: amino acid ABC transporter ATP-binding protein [Candidatus Improbicoccus devescovinae]|nr:MAG: amino acid ABC transporter ATP-binding protein [Candidatus Improbicoccus devescovinae]
MTNMVEKIMTIQNLSFSKNKQILTDINLEIYENQRICIIGPSGAGKSTFLRCLNLLERPTSGDILFENMSILNSNNINILRTKIGMVFQHFNLFSHLTIKQNITIALKKVKKIDTKSADQIAINLLNRVELLEKENEYPSNLSGGEKQRVAIIRTIAMAPRLLLVDEPTSALDTKMVKEISNIFMNFLEKNMSIICISHDMNFVRMFANRIIIMQNGQIIKDRLKKDENFYELLTSNFQ